MKKRSGFALIAAARIGWLRNISVMAPARHLHHNLEVLRTLQGEVCLGLHATITSEWEVERWGPVGEYDSAVWRAIQKVGFEQGGDVAMDRFYVTPHPSSDLAERYAFSLPPLIPGVRPP